MADKKAREPIATWYDATCRWRMNIEAVKVVAFTEKTVTRLVPLTFDDGSREERLHRVSEYSHFYPTLAEARRALIEGCNAKIARAEEELAFWRKNLASIADIIEKLRKEEK